MFLLPSQLSLFSGIDDAEFQARLADFPLRKFPKGFVIFQEGEPGTEVFGVLSGQVEVLKSPPGGDLLSVAQLKPGDVFGEFSFLTGMPRSTSAVACEDAVLLEIPSTWLEAASARLPVIAARLDSMYRTRVLTNILHGTRVFGSLGERETARLASLVIPKKARKGEVLIREGERGEELIVVKRGRIEITKEQGGKPLILGQVGPGEILGEMALVTGEPRSASATTLEEVEYLLLPGDLFKSVLRSCPRILKAIEDIVRFRSEQTRRSLEAVVDEIVGEEWSGDGEQELHVSALRIPLTFEVGEVRGEGKLLTVSTDHWTLEGDPLPSSTDVGTPVAFRLGATRLKELKEWETLQLNGSFAGREGATIRVSLRPDPSLHLQITQLITILARARIRSFVYPSYDTASLDLSFSGHLKNKDMVSGRVLSISQTQAVVRTETPWPLGEFALIRVAQKGVQLFSCRALCLSVGEGGAELQFEYDSSESRNALESGIRDVAKSLGFGFTKSAGLSAGARAPADSFSRDLLVLTKHFESPKEFVKTYLTSIERGRLRVDCRTRPVDQQAVKVQISVSDGRGTRRVACAGIIRHWKNGFADVELDDRSGELTGRLQKICRELVDRHSQRCWEGRRKELRSSGVSGGEAPRWIWLGGAVVALTALSLLGIRAFLSRPVLESVPLEGVPSVAAPSEPVIREKVPTRQMGVVPRRSSTRAEKMNLTEDPPSRDFIESHKKEIQDGLRRQIEAARRVATLENDPKRLSEIQTRIRSAERSLAEIEAVDPGNATTWNVGEKKSPSK